jgi:anti-sigma B factor antagonist
MDAILPKTSLFNGEGSMDFEVTEYKRSTVLYTSGRVDSYTAPELENALNQLVEQGQYNIIFDMRDVTFVSSAGWWALIRVQKEVKKMSRGEVVLVKLDERIKESMDLVGIGNYFKIFTEVIDAVGSF